jgi:hypothetical protein
MLLGFCKELSPFKLMQDIPKIHIPQCAHLLDYLYDMIVPKVEAPPEIISEADDQPEAMEGRYNSSGNSSHIRDLFSEIWKIITRLNKGPVRLLKRLLFSRPCKVILKLHALDNPL